MNSAQFLYSLHSWSQEEMVGIDEQELSLQAFELAVEEAFDRALTGNRRKSGRFYIAVGSGDDSCSGRGTTVCSRNLKAGHYSLKWQSENI